MSSPSWGGALVDEHRPSDDTSQQPTMTTSRNPGQANSALGEASAERVDVEALLDSGTKLLAQGSLAQARQAGLSAARAAPRSASAWALLGRAAAALGHPHEAMDALRRALEIDDSDLDTTLTLAELCRTTGHNDEALALAGHVLSSEARTRELSARAAALHHELAEARR